jgi:hypothetical protein
LNKLDGMSSKNQYENRQVNDGENRTVNMWCKFSTC